MKLLNYSAQKYLSFSIVLVLLSIPIFYVVLNKLFIHSVDESLEQQAELLPEYTKFIDSEDDLTLWKNLDWDVILSKDTGKVLLAKPYTVEEYSKIHHEFEQYRVLEKQVSILGKKYIIAFKSSLVEKDDLIKAVLGLLITLLIFLTAGSIYINHFISKRIWQPFRLILDYLKKYDLDKKETVWTNNSNITEFDELTVSVNDLTQRSRKIYLAQKEFTENASHELQTPLAIIKSKLELFIQQESLSEEQSLLIGDMSKALAGIEKLNLGLLLLAKMDNGQYQLNEHFGVGKLVQQSILELAFLTEPAGITVKFNTDTQVDLLGNQQLYGQMIKNLLVNAIKYSAEDSTIHVTLNNNMLCFTNPGSPLPFDKSQLFRRFSKHDSVKNGNGLGLSISAKIASLHLQKLAYNYASGTHHFTVFFEGN